MLRQYANPLISRIMKISLLNKVTNVYEYDNWVLEASSADFGISTNMESEQMPILHFCPFFIFSPSREAGNPKATCSRMTSTPRALAYSHGHVYVREHPKSKYFSFNITPRISLRKTWRSVNPDHRLLNYSNNSTIFFSVLAPTVKCMISLHELPLICHFMYPGSRAAGQKFNIFPLSPMRELAVLNLQWMRAKFCENVVHDLPT